MAPFIFAIFLFVTFFVMGLLFQMFLMNMETKQYPVFVLVLAFAGGVIGYLLTLFPSNTYFFIHLGLIVLWTVLWFEKRNYEARELLRKKRHLPHYEMLSGLRATTNRIQFYFGVVAFAAAYYGAYVLID